MEEEKEGKGERVCVWARERGREVRRKGVRKGGREGRGMEEGALHMGGRRVTKNSPHTIVW